MTYVATANAVSYCGATPNFLDIENGGLLGICPVKLEKYLKKLQKKMENLLTIKIQKKN